MAYLSSRIRKTVRWLGTLCSDTCPGCGSKSVYTTDGRKFTCMDCGNTWGS